MSRTQPTGALSGTPGYGDTGASLGAGSTVYGTTSGGTDTATQPGSIVEHPGGLSGGSSAGAGSSVTLFGWLLGWAVFIFFLWLLTRSRAGYTLVYYGAWAALMLLILTQYRWFVAVLAPVSGLAFQPPSSGGNSTSASSGGGGAGGSF